MDKITAKEELGILAFIGNTPLVPLKRIFGESKIHLYAKLEMFNPGGSIKDRTAFNIIKNAIDKGTIGKNTTIIESTSGNMGIGLARICHYFGLRLILVTDPHINPLSLSILKTFHAEIIIVDEHDGKGGYLNTRLAKVQQLQGEITNSFWTNQYNNMDNPLAHEETFLEVVHALGKAPDYIFVATSTCGTLRGLADAIAKHEAHTKIVAVDAVGSIIFGHKAKKRIIPGMGASRPSSFLIPEHVSEVLQVSDKQSVEGCHKLLKKESILVGGSAGAIVKAMEQKWKDFEDGATVVAIMADNGDRYLNTIYSQEWINKHFTSITL